MELWIDWNGGECPVTKGTLVDIKYRDGDAYSDQPAGESGFCRDWSHTGKGGDIVSYRLSSSHSSTAQTRRNDELLSDAVNSPKHYANSTIECIDAIEASMSREEFRGYLKGNVQKYVWRYRHKGGVEDLKKSQWYANRLISNLETQDGK